MRNIKCGKVYQNDGWLRVTNKRSWSNFVCVIYIICRRIKSPIKKFGFSLVETILRFWNIVTKFYLYRKTYLEIIKFENINTLFPRTISEYSFKAVCHCGLSCLWSGCRLIRVTHYANLTKGKNRNSVKIVNQQSHKNVGCRVVSHLSSNVVSGFTRQK